MKKSPHRPVRNQGPNVKTALARAAKKNARLAAQGRLAKTKGEAS